MRARLAALKLPQAPVFPRDAAGRLDCGNRIDCFIHAVESCQTAALSYRQSVEGYGLQQTVVARYEILGRSEQRCRVARTREHYAVRLDPAMAEGLARGGKTPQEIEDFRLDAEALLAARNPPRLECELDEITALEVALDLIDGRHRPEHWRGRCTEPGDGAGAGDGQPTPPGSPGVPPGVGRATPGSPRMLNAPTMPSAPSAPSPASSGRE